jgi:hypothetical protein
LFLYITTYTKINTFPPTLKHIYFDVLYQSRPLAFVPYVGSDYLPPLSVPDFVLTLVRRSCARYTAAAFPAIIVYLDNILIYSNNKLDYKLYIKKVLD